MVASLCLLEAPPVHASTSAEFRAVAEGLATDRAARGAASALDRLQTLLLGSTWPTDVERLVLGGVAVDTNSRA